MLWFRKYRIELHNPITRVLAPSVAKTVLYLGLSTASSQALAKYNQAARVVSFLAGMLEPPTCDDCDFLRNDAGDRSFAVGSVDGALDGALFDGEKLAQ